MTINTMMTPGSLWTPMNFVTEAEDAKRLARLIEVIQAELLECQQRQRLLIAALHKAKAEVAALDGGPLFFDGERLICG